MAYIDLVGQYVSAIRGENDPIPALAIEQACAFIAEAIRNGKDANEVIINMLGIAAQAMQQGIYPCQTQQIIGEPVGDQQCFHF